MTQSSQAPDQEQPFISHLLELRDRLLRMVFAVLVVFLLLFPFANDIYVWVASPLMALLPEGTSMIATGVASPFLTPFKLSLVGAVFLAMPFILYQFWAFVAPGLYQHEKRLAMPLLVSSVALFYVGMLFAYYVVFPLVFRFLTSTAPEGVAMMTDIAAYLDFVLTLFFAFGLAFEVPIATILLVATGMTTPESLVEKRPYIIVGAFAIGMLLTPPDVISQTLLAVPMWVLFELGVIFSRMFMRQKQEREGKEQEAESSPPARRAPAADTSEPIQPRSDLSSAEDLDQAVDDGRFRPMTDGEMEAELDAIEAEEEAESGVADAEIPAADPIEALLQRVQRLRDEDKLTEARQLLYQVLEEGNSDQRRVARNILEQLD